MKGMMVSLLIFAMTGIVVGQQQTTSNQFGGNSNGANSDLSRYIAPFELPISTDQIQGLMNGAGTLASRIAPIDPQSDKQLPLSVVSEIVLFHQPNGDRVLPTVKLVPEKGNDGVLRFGLTKQDLNDLRNKKFTYSLPIAERGKFNRVECYFVDPTRVANTPTPDDTTGNSRIQFGPTGNSLQNKFGQQTTRPFDLGLPGPEPGDDDFMGPVPPQQFTNGLVKPNRWTPENPNGNQNPAINNQTAGKKLWTMPAETPMEQLRRQQAELDAQRQRQKEIDAYAARQLEVKQQNELRDAIARRQQQIAKNAQPPWNTDLTKFTPKQPFQNGQNGQSGNQTDLASWEQQLIAKQNADKAQQLLQYEQELAQRVAKLKEKEDELNYRNYLESTRTTPIASNPRTDNSIYNQTTPIRNPGQIHTGTDIFTGPVITPNPNMAKCPIGSQWGLIFQDHRLSAGYPTTQFRAPPDQPRFQLAALTIAVRSQTPMAPMVLVHQEAMTKLKQEQ